MIEEKIINMLLNEDELKELKKVVEDLIRAIDNITNRVNDLEEKIKNIEERITAIEKEVNELKKIKEEIDLIYKKAKEIEDFGEYRLKYQILMERLKEILEDV